MRNDISISENLGDLNFIFRPPAFTVNAVWGTESNDNILATCDLPRPLVYNNVINGIGVSFERNDSIKPIMIRFTVNNPNGSSDTTSYSPLVDGDGNAIRGVDLIKFGDNFTLRVYDISGTLTGYDANITDLQILDSIDQNEFLLLVADRGNVLESPLIGVGAYNYLNSILPDTDFALRVREGFALDGLNVTSIELNPNTNEVFIQSEEF